MSTDWPCLSERDGRCVLALAVVPHARRNGADGLHDGCLRVRLAAPPVDGKANAALLAWLAAQLHCPQRSLQLLQGEHTRRKRVAVDLPAAQVQAWLATALPAPPVSDGC